MSGSFQSVLWNTCMHRLDLGLYSERVWGNGVRKHVNFKEKIPSTGDSEGVRTRDAASCRTESPAHHRVSYSGPLAAHTIVGISPSQRHNLRVAETLSNQPTNNLSVAPVISFDQ